MGPRLSIVKAYTKLLQMQPHSLSMTSVNQTAESCSMTKVKKSSKQSQRQSWMAVSKHFCQLEVDTNKHEDLHLMLANHREEDEI
jgi:hypothetical protein